MITLSSVYSLIKKVLQISNPTKHRSVVCGEAVGDRALVVEEGLLAEPELVVGQMKVRSEEQNVFRLLQI